MKKSKIDSPRTLMTHMGAKILADTLNADPADDWSYDVHVVSESWSVVLCFDEDNRPVGEM